MDHPTPDRPSSHEPAPIRPAALDANVSVPRRGDAAALEPSASLGELLVAMRSDDVALREAAWAACYQRYYQVVWTRVFYVMRSIAWLSEPREAAADVTSNVFVGLPAAAKHYREEGKAEWWLKQVAVRAALRKKEALTGRWATGRRSKESERGEHGVRGRSYISFEETADHIVDRLDAVEHDELLELHRRRAALRSSPDETKRRWDEFLELYVAGYDFRDIGARMGITEASARNWLCKIRKHLTQPVHGE